MGDNTEETMAQRLTRLREGAGLTQAKLAAKLTDVAGAGTVGGWESTEGKKPRLDTLVELSDLYGVELYWLVTGRGPEKRTQPEDAVIRLRVVHRALTSDINLLRREEAARQKEQQAEALIAGLSQVEHSSRGQPKPDPTSESDETPPLRRLGQGGGNSYRGDE